MLWTKAKKAMEDLLADSVKNHVQYHITRYGPGFSHHHRRAWVTWDKQELVTMSNDAWDHVYYQIRGRSRPIDGLWKEPIQPNGKPLSHAEATEVLRQRGIFSHSDFYPAAEEYVNLSIDSALESENPIIRALAMFDRRLGKRRLTRLSMDAEHELVKIFYRYRCQAEDVRL